MKEGMNRRNVRDRNTRGNASLIFIWVAASDTTVQNNYDDLYICLDSYKGW